MEQAPKPEKNNNTIEKRSVFKKAVRALSKPALFAALSLLPNLGQAEKVSGDPEGDKSKTRAIEYVHSSDTAATPEDMYRVESMESLEEIKLDNYFETDRAEISEENKEKIEAVLIEDFLSQIDENNIDAILASEFAIYSSCDERKSSNFETNLDLGQARFEVLRDIVDENIDSYEFDGSISEEKAQKLRDKEFVFEYPQFEDAEPGVVPTEEARGIFGENLSEEELQSLVRYSVFKVAIEKHKLADMERHSSGKEAVEQIDITSELKKLLDPSKDNVVLFDGSGSMKDNREDIAKLMQDYPSVQIGTFTNKLDVLVDGHDEGVVEDALSKSGPTKERAIRAANESLEELEDEVIENINLVIVTDESLQDISQADLQSLQEKLGQAQDKLKILVLENENNETAVLSLTDIEASLKTSAEYVEELQKAERILKRAQEKLATPGLNKDARKLWEKAVANAEEKIESAKEGIYTITKEDMAQYFEK